MRTPRYTSPRYSGAVEEQLRLKGELRFEPLPARLRYVGGADVSISRFGKTGWGGLVVCDLDAGLEVVDTSVVSMDLDFPYIPGMLGFREVPVLMRALALLTVRPEVVLVDAQGTAHPRGFGSACHFGVSGGLPSVGCAKSLLCGDYEEPGTQQGARSPIVFEGDRVGMALRTRSGVAPVFVSPGHLSDMESSLELVLRCCTGYRIPMPIRLAHGAVNDARRAAGG